MPTVPNWIAKAVIYESRDYGRSAVVIPITGYRATKTQVVVTCAGARGPVERRFRLDKLTELGGGTWSPHMARLLPADSEKVIAAQRSMVREGAIETARRVADARLNSSMSAEQAASTISKMRDELTRALAALEPLL